jgi:uncharacterized protein
MFYRADPAADAASFARNIEVYPRHRAFLDEFAKRGQVWMIGTFGDPMSQGAMTIFTSREAAEEFAANDPFQLEGLVYQTDIWEWDPLKYPAPPES